MDVHPSVQSEERTSLSRKELCHLRQESRRPSQLRERRQAIPSIKTVTLLGRERKGQTLTSLPLHRPVRRLIQRGVVAIKEVVEMMDVIADVGETPA